MLLGFSPEDALQYINAADPRIPNADFETIAKSRKNMATTIKNYLLKNNEDFLC